MKKKFRNLEFGDIFINQWGRKYKKVNVYTKPGNIDHPNPIILNAVPAELVMDRSHGPIFIENSVEVEIVNE